MHTSWYTPWHEKTLLYRLTRDHDPEAFGELYDHYAPKIYRYVYFRVSTVPQAEDLTAEVFLKTWEFIQRQSSDAAPIANFRAFIYRLARNVVIDFYRDRARREHTMNDEQLTEVAEPEERGLMAVAVRSSDMRHIERALGKLKDEYREVVILRYIEGLATADIARVLDKTKGAVRVTLHRALDALREEMEQLEKKVKK